MSETAASILVAAALCALLVCWTPLLDRLTRFFTARLFASPADEAGRVVGSGPDGSVLDRKR